MQETQSSVYKGYFITTRWAVTEPPTTGAERWFSASFSVDPPDPSRSSWQQFPKAVFANLLAAMANALISAMKSIDHDIAAAGGWGLKPPRPPP